MSLSFEISKCQSSSNKKIFGLCDDPAPSFNPAYIDEDDGKKWIAVVENENKIAVTFTAIDHCVEIRRKDGKMERRCDGMLTYNYTIIFVELKQRGGRGNAWVLDAEAQLKSTINHFENTSFSEIFRKKKAYISNSEHPKFKSSQIGRMEKFYSETRYVLKIVGRIKIE
jgi:hypothetical protein